MVATDREVEDENVCSVPHGLVEDNHKDHKKVPDESDDNDECEENGDDDGDNQH